MTDLDRITPDEVETVVEALRLLRHVDVLSIMRDAETIPCPVTGVVGYERMRRCHHALVAIVFRATALEFELIERIQGESDRHVGRTRARRERAAKRAIDTKGRQ